MKKSRYTVRLSFIFPLLIFGIVSAVLSGCSEKPEQAAVSQESAGEKTVAAELPKVVESVPDQTLPDGGEEGVGISPEQAAPGTRADAAFPDVIYMDNRAYAEHTKEIVLFTHQKHMDAYAEKFPDLFKEGCGACHHDADNKPLVLEAGDAVQDCIECHKIPGERPKGKDAPELSKEERLAYHAEALHYNCKDCHSAVNKETGTKEAPTTCTKCHLKPA